MQRSIVITVALVAALAAAALASPKEGDAPPPLSADARFLQGDAVTLDQLRGKVVALQLAHTSSKPCAAEVPKIHELIEKHAEGGFVFVWVFEEGSAEVEAYVKKSGAKFPVVAEYRNVRKHYDLVKGFPTTYLLDLDGKVKWVGNFVDRADATIGALLKGKSDLPWLPAELAPITKLLEKKEYVPARTALVAARTRPEGEPQPSKDDVARIDTALAWLDGLAAKLVEKADAQRAAGNVYEAYKAYRELAALHAGSESAANAETAVEELMADEGTKREIEGWIFFDESLAAAQEVELKDPKQAIRLLKKVMTRFRGTAAAAKAKYWVERLEAQ